MQVDRRALAFFITNNACPQLLRLRSLAILEPFYRKAEAGYYDVACGDKDKRGIRAALSTALGEDVLGIAAVGIAEATCRGPEYLRRLRADIGRTLACAIGDKYEALLTRRLGKDGRERMERVFWESVGEPVWRAFEGDGNRWAALGVALLCTARAGLLAAASDLCGFASVGDVVNLSRLAPLVRALTGAVILGERANAPEVWIVITD